MRRPFSGSATPTNRRQTGISADRRSMDELSLTSPGLPLVIHLPHHAYSGDLPPAPERGQVVVRSCIQDECPSAWTTVFVPILVAKVVLPVSSKGDLGHWGLKCVQCGSQASSS